MDILIFSRFGQKFVNKVANVKDIVHFMRKKSFEKKEKKPGKYFCIIFWSKMCFMHVLC